MRCTRFEALEPIRQGVRDYFGGFGENVAQGLTLRHDHGSQYLADDFQAGAGRPRPRARPSRSA